MKDEFTIQCPRCGSIYNDLEEICPDCGEPQPIKTNTKPQIEIENPYLDLEEEPLEPMEAYEEEQEYTLPYSEYPSEETEGPELLPETYHEEEYLDEPYEEFEGYSEPLYEESYLEEEPLEEDYLEEEALPLLPEEEYLPETPLADHEEYYEEHPAEYEEELYEEDYEYEDPDSDLIYEEELEYESEHLNLFQRLTQNLMVRGCLSLVGIMVLCTAIAGLATYDGIQESVTEIRERAEGHYRKGEAHRVSGSIELAIAEFEQTLSLDPDHPQARNALIEAQTVFQRQPTPTSKTRTAAAVELLKKAEGYVDKEDWFKAFEALSQIRDLDADYEAEHISDLLYTTNYELGQQLVTPDRVGEAITSFERALTERPKDTKASIALSKAELYITARKAFAEDNLEEAVEAFNQLYQEDEKYLDVKQRLLESREKYGDELADQEEWCTAEIQYLEASDIQSRGSLDTKIERSNEFCQESPVVQKKSTPSSANSFSSPTQASKTSSPEEPRTRKIIEADKSTSVQKTTPSSGTLYYSAYNIDEANWQIFSLPATGGTPKTIVVDATMPSLSPNGQYLLYRSDLIESEGLHIFDLTTGTDSRVTIFGQHILPRWGGENDRYLFVTQEPQTGRWVIQIGYVDGSDPIKIWDGRTPDWSNNNQLIAYQGTNPQGNEPGIYTVPTNGGNPTRITNHSSDRSPSFSPNDSKIAYMSTQKGSFDIYVVDTEGGQPRQITDAPGNEGLPAWSPDGNQLAYVSDSEGSWGIYVINATGGQPTRIGTWNATHREDWLMAQIWWGD